MLFNAQCSAHMEYRIGGWDWAGFPTIMCNCYVAMLAMIQLQSKMKPFQMWLDYINKGFISWFCWWSNVDECEWRYWRRIAHCPLCRRHNIYRLHLNTFEQRPKIVNRIALNLNEWMHVLYTIEEKACDCKGLVTYCIKCHLTSGNCIRTYLRQTDNKSTNPFECRYQFIAHTHKTNY